MAMDHPDVAIIGGGIFGLCAAWALHKRGRSVSVFEAGKIGAGASGGLIGALSPHMPEKWNAKKSFQFEALCGAEAFWHEIDDLSGMHSGYGRIGRMMPLHTEHARQMALARKSQAEALWAGQAKWDVIEEGPGLRPAEAGFVKESMTARINPRRALGSLAAALRSKGVKILEDTPVQPKKLPTCGSLLLAAGWQMPALTPGLPGRLWSGVKGQSARLDARLPGLPVIFDGGIYVVEQGTDGVAVGSTSETDWSGARTTDERLEVVIEKARALVPELGDAPVLERWAGVRPRGKLPDPVVGRIKERPDHWVMGGGFKIGLALAPLLAERLADLMGGQAVELPPSFLLETHLERL